MRVQIAIDTAIFPEGTSGAKLDVLARKALWQDGLNYMVRFPYLARRISVWSHLACSTALATGSARS